MPSAKVILSASAIAFFTSASAHMVITKPAPYGSPDNGPIEASGSNFPCKSTSNANGPITEMAIGAPQQLELMGSAVHGGGSCQISLTKDNPATKQSKWMVIHSIEGGCPARSQPGNFKENETAKNPDKYDYKIPEGIAPGTYTLAWTWFNLVGNREMYMNCANVKVTGGSSKRDTYHNETYAVPELSERDTPSFPDLFIANVPTSDCKTEEGVNVKFPDPGKSVEQAGDSKKLGPPTGPKCGGGSAAASGAGQGTGTQSAGGDAGAGSGAGSGASGQNAGTGQGSGSGGQGAVAPSAGGSSAAAAPKAASTGASNSSGSTSAGSTAAPPSTDSTSTSCTSPGQSICSPDGKQIGTCDSTNKAVMIPVPASTICKGGVISVSQKFKA